MRKPTSTHRRRLLAQMDLSMECPLCHARLQPAEQNRLDMFGTMLCPHCKKTFVAPATGPSTS